MFWYNMLCNKYNDTDLNMRVCYVISLKCDGLNMRVGRKYDEVVNTFEMCKNIHSIFVRETNKGHNCIVILNTYEMYVDMSQCSNI